MAESYHAQEIPPLLCQQPEKDQAGEGQHPAPSCQLLLSRQLCSIACSSKAGGPEFPAPRDRLANARRATKAESGSKMKERNIGSEHKTTELGRVCGSSRDRQGGDSLLTLLQMVPLFSSQVEVVEVMVMMRMVMVMMVLVMMMRRKW